MQFGIAMYDALVGASVPAERAASLVQAMETEMIERLATKEQLLATKQELTLTIGAVEQRLGQRISALDEKLTLTLTQSISSLRDSFVQKAAADKQELKHEIVLIGNKVMLSLGALIVAVAGLFSALKII